MFTTEAAGMVSSTREAIESLSHVYSAPNPTGITNTEPTNARPVVTPRPRFPPALNLYKQSTFTKTFVLGVHKNQPLFAVKSHSGSRLVLHSGPTVRDPPLAAVESSGLVRRRVSVLLPPLPKTATATATLSVREPVTTRVTFKIAAWGFAVEVGDVAGPGPHRREQFEWRFEPRHKTFRAWKLVRLGGPPAPGPRATATTAAATAGSDDDGLEVLAVMGMNPHASMSKFILFRFLGRGLTGELGQRWEDMAVIISLAIIFVAS